MLILAFIVCLAIDNSSGNMRGTQLCGRIILLVERHFGVICREDGPQRLGWGIIREWEFGY